MPGSTPKASTVAKKVGQGADRGRPPVIAYPRVRLASDSGRTAGYKFLWQTTKPQPLAAAQELMDVHMKMPLGLQPQALQRMNAAKHRREHRAH